MTTEFSIQGFLLHTIILWSFRKQALSTPAHSGVLPYLFVVAACHATSSVHGEDLTPVRDQGPRYLSNNFARLIANLVWLPPLCFRSWWVGADPGFRRGGGFVHSEGGVSYRNFRSGSKLLQGPGQINKQKRIADSRRGGGSDHPKQTLYPRMVGVVLVVFFTAGYTKFPNN